MEAIVRDKKTIFADLVKREGDLKRVYVGLMRAVEASFKQDKAEHPLSFIITQKAIEDRTEICIKWFSIMRGDCGYSVDRAIDFLPRALRTELDGGSFEPPKADTGWAPSVLVNS